MTLTKAINKLNKIYKEAKDNHYIKKPISWALYRTWRWANEYEKERE